MGTATHRSNLAALEGRLATRHRPRTSRPRRRVPESQCGRVPPVYQVPARGRPRLVRGGRRTGGCPAWTSTTRCRAGNRTTPVEKWIANGFGTSTTAAYRPHRARRTTERWVARHPADWAADDGEIELTPADSTARVPRRLVGGRRRRRQPQAAIDHLSTGSDWTSEMTTVTSDARRERVLRRAVSVARVDSDPRDEHHMAHRPRHRVAPRRRSRRAATVRHWPVGAVGQNPWRDPSGPQVGGCGGSTSDDIAPYEGSNVVSSAGGVTPRSPTSRGTTVCSTPRPPGPSRPRRRGAGVPRDHPAHRSRTHERGDDDVADIAADGARTFVRDHIGAWIDAWAARVGAIDAFTPWFPFAAVAAELSAGRLQFGTIPLHDPAALPADAGAAADEEAIMGCEDSIDSDFLP